MCHLSFEFTTVAELDSDDGPKLFKIHPARIIRVAKGSGTTLDDFA